MGKLLFWVVLIIAVLFVARIAARMAAARQADDTPKARRSAPAPAAPATPESMVRCAHCGIHLPRSEAVLQNGMTWCSVDHAKLGPARK